MRKHKYTFRYIIMLASLALLFIGYQSYLEATQMDRLFHDHFEPIPEAGFGTSRALSIVASASTAVRDQALAYQFDKKYDFALSAWRAYLEEHGESDQVALLYAATTALASGQDEQATWYLNKITAANSDELVEEVNWYKALCLLKHGQTTASITMLNNIQEMPLSPVIRQQLPILRKQLQSL